MSRGCACATPSIWGYPADDPTPPAVDGDTLTVGVGLGIVYKRKAADLSPIWRRSVYGSGEREQPMTALGLTTIVASGYVLAVMDRASGRVRWGRRAVDLSDYAAAPVLTAGAIYGVTRAGTIVAYAPADGTLRWSAAPTAWHNPNLGDTWASPCLAGNRLYVAAEKVACVDAASGRVLWSKALPTGEYSLQPVVTAGGRVFVAGAKGVTAVSATTGSRLWHAARWARPPPSP